MAEVSIGDIAAAGYAAWRQKKQKLAQRFGVLAHR